MLTCISCRSSSDNFAHVCDATAAILAYYNKNLHFFFIFAKALIKTYVRLHVTRQIPCALPVIQCSIFRCTLCKRLDSYHHSCECVLYIVNKFCCCRICIQSNKSGWFDICCCTWQRFLRDSHPKESPGIV